MLTGILLFLLQACDESNPVIIDEPEIEEPADLNHWSSPPRFGYGFENDGEINRGCEKDYVVNPDGEELTFKIHLCDYSPSFNQLLTQEFINSSLGEIFVPPYLMDETSRLIYREVEVDHIYERYGKYKSDEYYPPFDTLKVVHPNEMTYSGNEYHMIKHFDNDGWMYLTFKFPCNNSGSRRLIRFYLSRELDKSSTYHGRDYVTFEQNSQPVSITAHYKRQKYTSEVDWYANGKIKILDSRTNDLITQLNNEDEIATVVYGNDIYFFDNNDLETNPGLRQICARDVKPEFTPIPHLSRLHQSNLFPQVPSGAEGYLQLCTGVNQSGSTISRGIWLTNGSPYWEEYSLQRFNIDDFISSIGIGYYGDSEDITSVLTVWEWENFNGDDKYRIRHRMSFIADRDHREIKWNNLALIPCIGSQNTWDNRISSFSFHFGNYGINMKDF